MSSESDKEFRIPGPLESLFQEMVRRAAAMGVAGLVSTEEALRKAFEDTAPPEILTTLARQTDEARGQLFEALSQQFGDWLTHVDPGEILGQVLEDYDVTATVQLRFERKADAEGDIKLEVVPPRK